MKRGRPAREVPLARLNLLMATAAKERAIKIASDRGFSVSRLLEYIIMNVDDSDPFTAISLKSARTSSERRAS
jgi:hypothetical protein